jgi:hypothetical protein
VNISLSKTFAIETGVPQGSILSPTLFSIFINDIPTSTHYRNQSCLFADDLCTLFYSKSLDETKKQLQKYLDQMEKWRLNMSPSKCNYIIFHNGSRNIRDINLLLYNEQMINSK